MTVQIVLTGIAIATVVLFTASFIADFTSTILQAWRATEPKKKPQLLLPEPQPQIKADIAETIQDHL